MKRTNVAHRLPRGKRAAWNGNQYFQKQQSLRKQPFSKIRFNRTATLVSFPLLS
ncbi:hypothetical protein IHV12_03170 [Fictibacillus sp. 7GRE50]|uniref:hypothetical protein n=1 Tax=Fictibacillus sp. 7GRE50 TaxID=2745878 RepID=UPI0018CF9DD4|nr:hypothetical protein [Fictibacillus sp. 7GRE50]MBH0163897.1 hypothetical protein [Fictibacillus sp. 7GRE50]